MNRIQLRDDLVVAFTEAELAQLCSRFGLNYDALSGKSQRDKAAVLIGVLERRGRLHLLLREVTAERPHLAAKYQKFMDAESAEEEARLSWLDQIAAGQVSPIEETPTMTWESKPDDGYDE